MPTRSATDLFALTAAQLQALYDGLPDPTRDALGPRAARTRAAIVDAARGLVLEHGYAGLRIGDITAACCISRAAFYTYFKDTREVFGLLTALSYRDCLTTQARWATVPDPASVADIARWVRDDYFAFMDAHGAFNHAATRSAPDDEAAQAFGRHLQLEVAVQLGECLRARQPVPTATAAVLGMATEAMLNRIWHGARMLRLPVDGNDTIRTAALLIRALITAGPPPPSTAPVRSASAAEDDAVLTAARALFVERGYAATTDDDLLAACGLTRTEWRARFGGKRELFLLVAMESLRAVNDLVDTWDRLPTPCTHADVAGWVTGWFAMLDRHGPFIFLPAMAAAGEPEFAETARLTLMRVTWSLGTKLRARQADPTDAPDALGLAVLGLVGDTWFLTHRMGLPVPDHDLVPALASGLLHVLTADDREPAKG